MWIKELFSHWIPHIPHIAYHLCATERNATAAFDYWQPNKTPTIRTFWRLSAGRKAVGFLWQEIKNWVTWLSTIPGTSTLTQTPTWFVRNLFLFLLLSSPYKTKWFWIFSSDKPEITRQPANVAVDEDSPVSGFCDAKGYPPPEITWEKVRGNKLVARGKNLFIPNARRSDKGRYRCMASNGFGYASAEFRIDVYCEWIL